jgi:cytochrome c oxidase subunit 2
MHGGTAWGEGSFDSNGEQIYFTGVNVNGERITYDGGPTEGMMMGGYLACASCNGPDGRGGRHVMHMQVMDAPDIRWSELVSEGAEQHDDDEHAHEGEYDLELFRRAVAEGEHPDGEALSEEMPRWNISDDDLADLMEYLMSLP